MKSTRGCTTRPPPRLRPVRGIRHWYGSMVMHGNKAVIGFVCTVAFATLSSCSSEPAIVDEWKSNADKATRAAESALASLRPGSCVEVSDLSVQFPDEVRKFERVCVYGGEPN